MSNRIRTILLTGFGPFPGVAENASAELVERLADAAAERFPRRRIVSAVLPTEWVAAPKQIAQLYQRHDPGIALHFGVSERAKGFVIETLARNECRLTPDAAGALPHMSYVLAKCPRTLDATLPVDDIIRRLRELNIPAEASSDAGRYLCNAVLFHALAQPSSGAAGRAVGFIHMPTRISDWDLTLAGALEILRASLDLPVAKQG